MSKSPLNLTLKIWQGQTFDFGFKLENDDGTPVDLTGYTASMEIREDVTSPTFIRQWGTADGHIVIDGPNGTIAFDVSGAETYALPTGNDLIQWVYDMLITSGDGSYSERPVQGSVVVYPAVTRPDPV